MQTIKADHNLPLILVKLIGKIIVGWAYLEHYFQRIVWDICIVDEKIGRIAVREPRLADRLDMISDLAFLRGIPVNDKKLARLKSQIEQLQIMRDYLAHGAWCYSETHSMWAVQVTKGNRPKPNSPLQPPKQSLKKRISPEGLLLNADALKTIVKCLNQTIEEAVEFRAHVNLGIDQISQTSLEKFLELNRESKPPRGQGSKKRRIPRRSLRG